MASVEILTIPIGSQSTSTIGANDKEDQNDFPVLFIFSENGTGLTEAGITLSAGASLVSLEGENSVWKGRVRPPQTAGTVTVTVVANAVAEGNAETSLDIEIVTNYPGTDAESPTLFLSGIDVAGAGIAVTPTRILISKTRQNVITLKKYTHAGIEQTSEQVSGAGSRVGRMDFINGDILVAGGRSQETGAGRYDANLNRIQTFSSFAAASITHSRLGITGISSSGQVLTKPYTDTTVTRHDAPEFEYRHIAHHDDLLYFVDRGTSTNNFGLSEIRDDDSIHFLRVLNIERPPGGMRDIAIYRDTMYLLGVNNGNIYTLDIRKYRPVAKRTKTTIYPVFVEAGDTIDLTQFSPDAERFTFDVGFKKPPYLSINASNELEIGSGAETIFVKLKAINRIDATETDSFGFYLIIRRAQSPVWRKVSELTMRAGSSYDLFQLVDADSIAFRSGRPRPTGSSLANGVFTVGTVGGVSHFTARKGSRSSHIEINIDVVQGVGNRSSLLQKNGVFRYRVEIAGIDVTPDLVGTPSVSETLDPIIINEYRVNEASIVLRNEGGKYNSDLAGNFWETHGLNAGGFQDAVKIYTEHFDGNGNWIENLLFTGLINESFEPIGDATFKMSCVDISSRLRKALAQDFGTLEKWDSLRKQSDEDSFEGTYVPERSLVPMQIGTGIARSDRTDLHISRLELPSEGPAEQNTAYMTPMELKTAGGFLAENPLLRFKTDHRSEDVRFLVSQLATNKEIYNTEIDIPGVEVEDPFLLNRGSVAFSVEPTRTTRLPVDWVHDSTNNRVLILLSNPEHHVADLLVQYDVQADSYRVLHTFDKGTAVHRIERRNATNYYILTSGKIQQDRSARQLPRPNDSTGYAYDSVSEGSEIKMYRYSTSSGTLTEHVAEDDTYPPQLGIQYPVGFENSLYIDTWEGIRPDDRGAFKWNGSYLYYRYAKDGEFGVARVNTGGTTTKMMGQAVGKYQNHLNFAFDITSTGTIYFVYAINDANSSTLTIKRRTSGGTESTILTDIRGLAAFSDIHSEFGAYLGAHEVLFHQNQLYILAPMQMADFGEDATDTRADPDFIIEIADTGMSGERNVTTSTALNPTSTRLAPGDDIPIRIDFNSTVSGATQSDVTVSGGTIQSFSISSDMIDVTIRPDDPTRHLNIVIDLAENAVTQRNEATRIIVDFGTRRSRRKTGGMALYKCNVTAGSPSLTAIDTWDFVHQAGCNLTVHEGAVHYVEQPSAATRFKPINPDLDGYWTDDERKETMGYNVLPESLGALKRINASGEVEHLGNVWHTDRPYNIMQTRMLSIEGDLHLCAAYGNGDEVLRFNSLASQADNMVHIVRGRTLHYVLPTFQPNGRSIYAALAGLAKSVNATLSFEKNVIMITDRRPFRAVTDGATGTGTGNLSFSDANKTFPSSGYLLIGKEILRYTGISSGAFTGITRGVLGSDIENHADASAILYLDTIIETEGLGSPYKKITLQSDTNRIFNIIRDSGGIAEVRDEASIALYGERPYNLDLSLTRHEKAWIEEIFASYLEELKDLQSIVNIQVRPDFSLRLGQIVPFAYKGILKAMRIVSVRYEKNSTHIKGRTVG